MASPLVECVPNVSEGRDLRAVRAIADAVRSVPGVTLADVHADPDHHRSVFTFIGSPPVVEQASLALASAVFAQVDMRGHHGIHPRLGALDVLPFVPLREVTMDAAAVMARRVAGAIAAAHHLPVYLYGASAARPERRVVRDVRRGEYEGLAARLTDPAWQPDAGPAVFVPRSGAVMVGARDVLVAYNVWLGSRDLDAARNIARAIRESSGGLPAVQALGLPLEQRGRVQVSINLVDYRRTGIGRVYDAVVAHAQRRGIPVDRAELVGLAPRAAFEGRRPETVGMPGLTEHQYLEHYL